MKPNKSAGFTLIELVIVVAIIAILAAVAFPAYGNYVLRGRRADAREMLQRVAVAQERFYTNRNQYTGDLTTAAGLGLGTTLSESGYYNIAVVVPAGGQTYTLTATPRGPQSSDLCANLVVNNVGSRSFSGSLSNGSCW